MRELEREHAERDAAAAAALREAEEAAAAAAAAAEELRRARVAAAREAAAEARRAARGPTPLRKRAAGANYEIAGRPAHLAPGAKLRSVERKGLGSVSRRITRSMKRRGSRSK